MGLLAAMASKVGGAVGAYRRSRDANQISGSDTMAGWGAWRWPDDRGVRPSERVTSDVERYASSDDVMAAVGLLADCAKTIPFRVLVNGKEDPEHDLAILLARGNSYLGLDWKHSLYSWLLLTGECYLSISRDNPLAAGAPSQIWPMSGHRLFPVAAPDRRVIQFYLYQPPGTASESQRLPIDPADIVPLLLWNPIEPLRGLSPLSSLRMGLDAEWQAKSTNRDLFANGLIADVLISAPGITEEQKRILRAELAGRHQGGGKRHSVLFAPENVEVEKLSLSPRDAEFLELDKLTTRDVAKAYRIPPLFLGDLEHATYSNFETGYRALWELAVMPRVNAVAAALTAHLSWQFGEDLVIEADTSEVQALQANAKEQADTLGVMVRSGIDRLWALRRIYGDEIPEEAVSNLVPTVLQPPKVVSPVSPVVGGPEAETPTPKSATKAIRPAQVAAARDSLAPAVRRLVGQMLQEQADGILAAWDAFYVKAADPPGDTPLDALPWQDAVASKMAPTMRVIIALGAEGGAESTVNLHALQVRPNWAGPVVEQFADATAAQRVQWINEGTRELLNRGIAEAIRDGRGLTGVRQAILDAFGRSDEPLQVAAYDDRVENIAQTELARAYNHGSMMAMLEAGVEWQTWRNVAGPYTRHADIDGQTVRVGEPFSVHGYPALYPAADSLPAGESVRCKCYTEPAAGPPEETT